MSNALIVGEVNVAQVWRRARVKPLWLLRPSLVSQSSSRRMLAARFISKPRKFTIVHLA